MSVPTFAKVLEVYRGAWVADIISADAPTGSFELDERTWSGTVIPTGYVQDGSRYMARIVGGKGKLSTLIPFKNYAGGFSLAYIAREIIAAGGEVAGTVTAPARVSYYERQNGTVGQCLSALCDAGGLTWWVARDGSINVAATRSTVSAIDTEKAHQVGADADGGTTYDVVTADDVQPGMLANGKSVRAIYWRLSSKSLHAECMPVQPSIPDTRGASFYQKTYSAKVEQQHADGSVDVIANGAFKLANVPLLVGVVGRVTLQPGELVTVGWLGGSPSAPYAVPAQAGADSSQPAALKGDSVEILLPPFSFVGTVNGLPATGMMTALTGQTLGTITGPCSQRTKLQ